PVKGQLSIKLTKRTTNNPCYQYQAVYNSNLRMDFYFLQLRTENTLFGMHLCFLCFSPPPPACRKASCIICPALTVGDLRDGYIHICSKCQAHKFGFNTQGYRTA